MPPRRGPGVCECGDVQMVPHDVVFACAAAVDLHRDTVAALIPQDVASTLWRIATTTEPIVTGGPASVLSALEQLPPDMVEEARMAVGGHLPEIQVPPIGGLFGPESLPRWMGGIDDSRRAAQTSVLESAHYVCEVAPQRVQILLQIVQHLMTQLLRDARGRSDDDRCTRQLASVVIVASAVTTRMRISGREADQAAIGLGLGTTVVLARVHVRRRDAGVEDGDHAGEEYEIVVWPAPPGSELVLRASDRLGHRLRGEPEPASIERPEVAFRPVADLFPDGATVTVTIGATLDQVLLGFRANPLPRPSNDPYDGLLRLFEIPSQDSERPGILVIEPGDFRGSEKAVLEALSHNGRAASMFWNVNAVTTLSVAENGELLDAFEGWDEATHPAVLALFQGLDLHDYQDKVARGLVVIERFTGCTVTEDLVLQMEAMPVGYRLSR